MEFVPASFIVTPETTIEDAVPIRVQDPLVRVSVPDVPPVIVTSTTATLDAFAMRIPELPTARDPPVRERFDVASVVVDPAESWIWRSPLQRRPFAAIEKVTAPLPAVDWNVTSWNSSPTRFAKVNVREDGESKITTPVPATQFVEVLLLDQEPANVQVPLPIRK